MGAIEESYRKKGATMSESKLESLAIDIYKWGMSNFLWDDCIIYFDDKAWSSNPSWSGESGKKIDTELYEYEDRNPLNYFEYANPDTLSMSFEGMLYEVLNGYCDGWMQFEEEFQNLFEKYGYYYEMGNAWNLSAYEL